MNPAWRIELLGGLRLRGHDAVITRFRTRKTGLLLAYLALPPGERRVREELIDLLWPELAPPAARNSLSQALSSLRRLMEPSGVPAGSVLVADRNSVRLEASAVTTDVEQFEADLREAERLEEPEDRARALSRALAHYRGPFLDGEGSDWAREWRGRLADAADAARAERARLAPLTRERSTTGIAADRPSIPGGVTAAIGRRAAGALIPAPLNRFFGREEELERLAERLAGERPSRSRLITLTGPGGSGKTRLALEAARRRVSGAEVPEAWFVPLADLADAAALMGTVHDALGLSGMPDRELRDQVVDRLARHPALLVLDSFEHLVEAGAPDVRFLVDRAPFLTCLVTSRCPLGLEGEQEIPVGPLPVPDLTPPAPLPHGGRGAGGVGALLSWPSIALFVDRARLVRPEFQLTGENAPAVAALCRGLDGIPLAIELAAARCRVLSPAQMAQHLERRLDFLVSRRRDAAARHRTLREAIDWSFRLLEPSLQQFFSRLSVFRGGWTAEAAQRIASLPMAADRAPAVEGVVSAADGRSSVIDSLEELRCASLIVAEEVDGAIRYRMLDTLRDYGRERLTGAEEAEISQRHAEYFATLAKEESAERRGPRQGEWLARHEREHDNYRAALAWSQRAPEGAEIGLDLVGTLVEFWRRRGHWQEARRWCETVLANPLACRPTTERAWALHGAAMMAWMQGDWTPARAWIDEGILIALVTGSLAAEAYCRMTLAEILVETGNGDVAVTEWRKAEQLYRGQGDVWGVALAINSLGSYAEMVGDEVTATPLWEESAVLFRQLGDLQGIGWCLDWEARVAARAGGFERARALMEEALAIRRELGQVSDITASLRRMGNLSRQMGDLDAARTFWEEALALYRELGRRPQVGTTLGQLAEVAEAQGDQDAARRYREESEAIAATTRNV